MTVLDAIGRTRLVPLRRIVPEGSARILVRLAVGSGMKYLSTALYVQT